jgi:hypothetical protein
VNWFLVNLSLSWHVIYCNISWVQVYSISVRLSILLWGCVHSHICCVCQYWPRVYYLFNVWCILYNLLTWVIRLAKNSILEETWIGDLICSINSELNLSLGLAFNRHIYSEIVKISPLSRYTYTMNWKLSIWHLLIYILIRNVWSWHENLNYSDILTDIQEDFSYLKILKLIRTKYNLVVFILLERYDVIVLLE